MRNSRILYHMITHKFYGGQGLHFAINLSKRMYKLRVETIWQDYAQIEIKGLSGVKNFILAQQGLDGTISDDQLEEKMSESIEMTLRLPEYSSYDAKISGSIDHVSTQVDSKLRGAQFSIDILSKADHAFFKYLQMEKATIKNIQGNIRIQTLISANAILRCINLEAQKIMTSQNLSIDCSNATIRSIILQNCQANVKADVLTCQSIQGKATICSKNLQISRLYSSEGQICIQSQDYNVRVESGTGVVRGRGKLELGLSHKGKIMNISDTKKLIV